MKQTIQQPHFDQAFRNSRPNDFSYEGLIALYEHLIELEEETGEELELDVIAICCDYTEYDGLEEAKKDYPEIEDMNTIAVDNGNIIVENI